MTEVRHTDAPRTTEEAAAKGAFEAFCKGRPLLEMAGIENAQDTVKGGRVEFASVEFWEIALCTVEFLVNDGGAPD